MAVVANKLIFNTNPNTVTTPSAPGTATVGVVAGQIIPANPARMGLVIVNLSTANVYLAFGFGAVAQSGLTLLPSIGWRMSEYDFNVESVSAISDAPGSIISIQEFSI